MGRIGIEVNYCSSYDGLGEIKECSKIFEYEIGNESLVMLIELIDGSGLDMEDLMCLAQKENGDEFASLIECLNADILSLDVDKKFGTRVRVVKLWT